MSCTAFLRAVTPRCLLLLLAVTLGWVHPPVGVAQTAPLVYRQVFVPADALNSQIRGLLPLDRSEFDRRVKQYSEHADGPPGPPLARIDQVICRARLEGNELRGAAEFAVVAPPGLALVALEPCGLLLGAATWPDDGSRPAIIGTDPRGKLACLAERSGRLLVEWRLLGTQASPDLMTFDLRLPSAARQRLEIHTPIDMELTVDSGLVVRGGPPADDPDVRLWTIELGASPRARLHVGTQHPRRNSPPLFVVRESTTYSLLQRTFDLGATFSLDVLTEPLQQLLLHVDPALQITALRLKTISGDQPLSLTPVGAANGKQEFIVQLPAGLSGLRREIEVVATGDLPTEKRSTLPRLSIADGVYQEGRASVAAPAWLRLEARPLQDCLQTAVSPAAPGRNLDQFDFQLHAASAAIEVNSDLSSAALRETSGTQIHVDGTQVTGVQIAELSSLAGETFALEAAVPRQWIIDAVETQPPDMLADRFLIPRGPAQQLLRLNLARPLSEARSMRLLIRAHYRRPANTQSLTNDFFRLATFGDVRDGRRIIAVRVVDPAAELQLSGNENLARLDPQQLTAAESKLFESPPGTLLFVTGPASEKLSARLVPATSRYRADVVVQALAAGSTVRQSASIRCQPASSVLASLLVRLAPRPRGAVAWRLTGDDSREIQATLISDAPSSEPIPDEALYRLTLARPQSLPFEVVSEWTNEDATARDIALAWLPEANVQSGLVEIHSPGGSELSISAEDIQPIPLPPAADDRVTTLRARYRYDSNRRARIRVAPAMPRGGQTAAWVNELLVTSLFSAAGQGQHEATLAVENLGLPELHIRLPPGTSDVRRLEGAASQEIPLSISVGGQATIPLPTSQRRAQIHLRYSSHNPPLAWHSHRRFTAPLPQFDVPIISRRWRVGLPPGLASVGWSKGTLFANLPSAAPPPNSPPKAGSWQSLLPALRGSSLATRLPAWPRGPEAASLQPVNAAQDLAPNVPAFAGWTWQELELPAGSLATLMVYRPAAVQVWSFSLALLALAVALHLRLLAHLVMPAAGLFAAIAVVAPAPWAWLAAGACLGLVAGGIALLVRPRETVPAPHANGPNHSSAIRLARRSAAGALACLWFTWHATLAAAPTAASPTDVSPRLRVVIPVNADQQPTGDYVYLDPEFYESLHRLSPLRESPLPDYLLESARYELPPAPHTSGTVVAVDELRVNLIIHTFRDGVTAELPLRRDEILLRDGSARLDGQPVTLAWRGDDAALLLTAPSSGKHSLDLALSAVARLVGHSALLDLSVPQAARSVVIVPELADARQPAAPEINGRSYPAGAEREIPLGRIDRLNVRWPIAGGAGGQPASLEADQLIWWNIRPGSVVANGRFRLRSVGGAIGHVLIDVDPRLRLVPGSTGALNSRVEEHMPNVLRVEVPESAGSHAELHLSWLWPDVSGSGSLVLPRVAVRADRVSRSWTAFTLDPSFEAVSPLAATRTPSAAEFLSAWGEAASVPSHAQDSLAAAPPSVFLVRPVTQLPSAKQVIDWSLSHALATLDLHVHLTDVPKTRLAHRLTMPPELKVVQAALRQNGNPAPVRWSQQPDGLLTITLLEAPTPEQELIVTAEMPFSRPPNRLPLPQVQHEDTQVTPAQIRIYRHEGALVSLESAAGWTPQDDAELGRHRDEMGRLVAVLESDAPSEVGQPAVSLAPNDSEVTGMLFIRADESDGDWRVEAELRLEVMKGLLDQVRLAIPGGWSGPLEFEPANAAISAVPDAGGRQVIVRPEQAAQQELRLTIRGPLTSAGGEVQAPDINVLDVPKLQRLVLLDLRSGADRIEWQTVGLRPADASSVALPSRWQGADGDLYQVVAPRFEAVAKERLPAPTPPAAHLADLRVNLHALRMSATAAFLVQPGGAREVSLEMPPGCRLIHVLADGVGAQLAPAGLRTWRAQAPSDRLPFVLTVVYDGAIASAAGTGNEIRLAAPRVVGMNVKRWIWTVRESSAQSRPITASVAPASLFEAELERLEAAARALADVAAAQASDLPDAIMDEALLRWRHAFRISQRRMDDLEAPAGGDETAWTERRASAEEEVARIERELLPLQADDEEKLYLGHLAKANEPAAEQELIFTGAAEALTFRLVPAARHPSQQPALWSALLAAGALLWWPLQCWPVVRSWSAANAHLILALVGLVWWLCFPLGWLGWTLVLSAIWLALRSPWRARSFEMGSTNRRQPLVNNS